MSYISFSNEKARSFIKEKELNTYESLVPLAHKTLHQKVGAGNEFLGWLNMTYDDAEIKRIHQAAGKIRKESEVLLVIGVGGSYLGAHAAIEMLNHHFASMLPYEQRQGPQVIFVGQHISSTYKRDLLEALQDKEVSINVISKSGTTTEPAIAFRIFRRFMEDKYGREQASKRIYATTDRVKGALKQIADKEGYETFGIPGNIGGRYSVLTPVGLLPMAVAGIDIEQAIQGAKDATDELGDAQLKENPAYQYAVNRNILYNKGFGTEIFANYEPQLKSFSEWWVQLFGESEGKDGKGIFPATANFSTDLHSFGQYIQDGKQALFETVVRVHEAEKDLHIEIDETNIDGLNYLAGMSLHEINTRACEGAMLAHTDGGVPNLEIEIPRLDAYTFGYMVYFFEKACAMSGYLLGVNPFDQPGVEAYKRNMFALLGKPGYEREREELESRIYKRMI
ncbi:MAG TPA: glucose-6-phosphate isomerase [Virgibacillus sp.]|nr:glucose-6-phosphate isomerase [Virgibacillus sp.]HLR66817.1 glucose-6-phosphate isomerase [Virgibacillus sp.]